MQDMVSEVLMEYANGVNKKNGKEYEKKKKAKKVDLLWKIGMIGVVHTFGRNMRFNAHVQVLLTEIKMKGKEVVEMSYLEYEYLRKVWQYKLINYMIKKEPKKKIEYLKMFKRYKDGFVINAKSRMEDTTGNWLYWIAGSTIINTIFNLFNVKLTFLIGLGTTQIIDGLIQVAAAIKNFNKNEF